MANAPPPDRPPSKAHAAAVCEGNAPDAGTVVFAEASNDEALADDASLAEPVSQEPYTQNDLIRGSIATSAERREQHGQEEVHPLVGFALDHTEESSLDNLQRVGLHIRQNKQ